jgi:hypothetical protein
LRAFERIGIGLRGGATADTGWIGEMTFARGKPVRYEVSVDYAKFLRTCDVVFTTLTPRVLVDVPKQDMAYATNSTRMYRQPGHLDERTRMLHLARKVRDSE